MEKKDEEELNYLNYSSKKQPNKITLYIILLQYFEDYEEDRSLNLELYCDNYSSYYNKKCFSFYHTFYND